MELSGSAGTLCPHGQEDKASVLEESHGNIYLVFTALIMLKRWVQESGVLSLETMTAQGKKVQAGCFGKSRELCEEKKSWQTIESSLVVGVLTKKH